MLAEEEEGNDLAAQQVGEDADLEAAIAASLGHGHWGAPAQQQAPEEVLEAVGPSAADQARHGPQGQGRSGLRR